VDAPSWRVSLAAYYLLPHAKISKNLPPVVAPRRSQTALAPPAVSQKLVWLVMVKHHLLQQSGCSTGSMADDRTNPLPLLISTICSNVPDPYPPGSPLAPGKSCLPLASGNDTGTSLTPVATVPEPIRFMLPSDLDGRNMTVFESAHTYLPKEVLMEDDIKQCLIDSLVEELNLKFLTELGTPALHSSGLASNDNSGLEKIVVVGGSHAARLAKELEKVGHVVTNMACPGFRITDESIEDLVGKITTSTSKGPVVFVFHMFDNNCFFSLLPDGSKFLPKRSTQDGKFHVPGQLEMIERMPSNLSTTSVFRLSGQPATTRRSSSLHCCATDPASAVMLQTI
jgi:hypothetical protein